MITVTLRFKQNGEKKQMTEHDKNSVDAILHGEGTWFTAKLFRLIAASDTENRARLFKGFPREVTFVHKHLTGYPFITGSVE